MKYIVLHIIAKGCTTIHGLDLILDKLLHQLTLLYKVSKGALCFLH